MKHSLAFRVLILTLTVHVYGLTVVTFSDPATDGSTPLFTVDGAAKIITGGWSDDQTGLDLEVVCSGSLLQNVFFTMTPLTMSTGTLGYDTTGPGTFRFYADGDSADSSAVPVFQIDFESAAIMYGGISGDNIFSGNGVVFSGSALAGTIVGEEVFSFSLANHKKFSNNTGYTATAAFTSSALPEPATLSFLAIGGIALFRRRR
jgi:hypothetical protein